ncbi:MAG: methylthioribulose 1-phosphate dehydratase [Leptospiraceae bacterium]|nr:methylthioribulose 1-phosphate dehydratase [Leptospiraceae bacterium]
MNFSITQKLATELKDVGRYFHKRKWSLATSSNYSAKVSDGVLLISSSGHNKDYLQEHDFMLVDFNGSTIESGEQRKPSAETLLHTSVYELFPEAGSVLHTHSVYASVLSRVYLNQGYLELSNYEMLKALDTIKTHDISVQIPIYPNSQNMQDIYRLFQTDAKKDKSMNAFLIAGHGLYTWSNTVLNARRHIEALEFLFECHYLESVLKGGNNESLKSIQ